MEWSQYKLGKICMVMNILLLWQPGPNKLTCDWELKSLFVATLNIQLINNLNSPMKREFPGVSLQGYRIWLFLFMVFPVVGPANIHAPTQHVVFIPAMVSIACSNIITENSI